MNSNSCRLQWNETDRNVWAQKRNTLEDFYVDDFRPVIGMKPGNFNRKTLTT